MGRQSKLDEPHATHGTRAEAIEAAMRMGNYIETAADYAGVSRRTVHRWLAEGKDADSIIEEHGEAEGVKRLTPHQFRLWQFWHTVTRARAACEVGNVECILEAGETDWRARAWFMERAFRSRWGRSDRLDVEKDEPQGSIEQARARLKELPDTPLASLTDDS